jgi:hypothetical protein
VGTRFYPCIEPGLTTGITYKEFGLDCCIGNSEQVWRLACEGRCARTVACNNGLLVGLSFGLVNISRDVRVVIQEILQ